MQPYVALCSSEELLKFGGGQKIFIFRGGGLPYEGEVRKFSFSEGGLPYEGGGVIF